MTPSSSIIPSTATVETLTAEVRVLMVGSRQVTISVFRQLDWVKLPECDVFGRVTDGDNQVVVGRRRVDGALVRASWPACEPIVWYATAADREERMHLDRQLLELKRLSDEMQQLQQTRDNKFASLEERGRAESNLAWNKRSQDSTRQTITRCQQAIAETDAYRESLPQKNRLRAELKARFQALPLIVLAGLR